VHVVTTGADDVGSALSEAAVAAHLLNATFPGLDIEEAVARTLRCRLPEAPLVKESDAVFAGRLADAVGQGAPSHLFCAGGDGGVEEGRRRVCDLARFAADGGGWAVYGPVAGGDGLSEHLTERESKPALAVLVDAARPDRLRRTDHDY